MLKYFLTFALFTGVLTCLGEINNKNNDFGPFLKILSKLESSDNNRAIGDNGRAIGRYQIHKIYWSDAIKYDKSIGGKYEDCFNKEYSERIIKSYLLKYCKKFTFEEMARIHNGGPNGYKKQATIKYWARFLKIQKH